MMSYGMRSRQSFSVFCDESDSDSEQSEFEEFTQKRLKLVTYFCLHIINLRLHPRVGSTRRPKQSPNHLRVVDVQPSTSHGVSRPPSFPS